MDQVDEVNAVAQRFTECDSARQELTVARAAWRAADAAVNGVDKQKTELMTASKLPVAGLGFSEGGVTLNGHPLEQASSAEQIQVGIALAAAANPKLRVCFIREGSLLDVKSWAAVVKSAKDNDLQIWIEVIKSDDPGAIRIVDGTNEVADAKP